MALFQKSSVDFSLFFRKGFWIGFLANKKEQLGSIPIVF